MLLSMDAVVLVEEADGEVGTGPEGVVTIEEVEAAAPPPF
jgi:hypothetical protein